MGVWQGMKRMIKGEPVFQASDQAGQSGVPQSDSSLTPTNQSGYKIIPEVAISDIDCNQNGSSFDLWVTIINNSNELIFLDKIYVLGRTVELDTQLSPNGSRKFQIYRGPVSTSQPQQYADVNYRLESSGDYFQARFFVEYDYESDGCYYPKDFNLQKPIRDI